MLANLAGVDLPILLVIAVVVIFGAGQLPKIARNVGSAGKEFRKAQAEAEAEDVAKQQAAAVTAGPVVAPVPVPPVTATPVTATPVAATPVVPGATTPVAVPVPVPDDDKVTISKSELAALLDERLGRGETSGHTN